MLNNEKIHTLILLTCLHKSTQKNVIVKKICHEGPFLMGATICELTLKQFHQTVHVIDIVKVQLFRPRLLVFCWQLSVLYYTLPETATHPDVYTLSGSLKKLYSCTLISYPLFEASATY